MKVLVLGGTGMAGHTIAIYFKEAGHNVTVFSRRKIDYCNNIIGDVTDFKSLQDIIFKGQYDAIINAVGILNQDAEDNQSLAILVNSYLPHFLKDITKEMRTKVIHMSTDCVFSGKNAPYSEESYHDGELFYDRTKALGELNDEKNLTFRNSIVGPDMKEGGIGLFNWFMNQDGEINGFTRAIWTGVSTLTLAKAMEKAVQEKLTGIYNLVNNRSISKFDLLSLFNTSIRDEEITIIPDNTIDLNKSLVNNREDFSFEVPSYEDMVEEMRDWIFSHKDLYPHYFS